MTSLAEQLRSLAIPKPLQQQDRKTKPSLLFDPAEAAKLDKDAVYQIGAEGLEELIKLDPVFERFLSDLFDYTTIGFERTVESKEVNKKLNKTIKKFLHLLSPYFLLKPAHKALEWLVCRFYIQDFNVDDLIALILPYHETKIFVRVLQLIDLNLPACNRWYWLKDLQKQGLHLPKSILVTHAISDSSFLRFICNTTLSIIKEHSKHNTENKLGTLITFFCTTLVSILSRGPIDDHLLTVMLPSFLETLTSNILDFKASGYMIGGQLVAVNQLSDDLNEKIISGLFEEESEKLEKERALFLVLIFQSQKPLPRVNEKYIKNFTWLVKNLKLLSGDGVLVGPLLVQVMKTCLDHIVNAGDDTIEAQTVSWSLITEVNCDLHYGKALIRLINAKYVALDELLKSEEPEKNLDQSLLKWMKELMGVTLEKYSRILDQTKDDVEFQKLREKWRSADEIEIQEIAISKLMEKCKGSNKESTWLQLRPLLLNKVESDKVFQVLCKIAPPYDNLVLLLCLEKILNAVHSPETNLEPVVAKIAKSKFGKSNVQLINICKKILGVEPKKIESAIYSCLMPPDEAENAIEFEPWLAALKELKKMNKIVDSNPVWSLGLGILKAALPSEFSPTHALQLLKLLMSLSGKKVKNCFDILDSIIKYYKKGDEKECDWFNMRENDSKIWLKVNMLECILGENTKLKEQYVSLLELFSKKCFFSQREFIRFLCSTSCGVPDDSDNRISAILRLRSFHLLWKTLRSDDKSAIEDIMSEFDQVVCSLLIGLGDKFTALQHASLKVIEALVSRFESDRYERLFLESLLLRSEEITADANQLNVALYCLLSPSESVRATLEADKLAPLSEARNLIFDTITSKNAPFYVSARILGFLESVSSDEIIIHLSALAHRAISATEENEIKAILDNFWSRIDQKSAKLLETNDGIWNLAEKCMTHQNRDKECPAVAFLQCITKEVFNELSEKRKRQLLAMMVTIRSQAGSTEAGSAVASVTKRIFVESEMLIPLIKKMTTIQITPQKKRPPASLSYAIIEKEEWKNGISLLELIQTKKKLGNSHLLLEPLFSVLKFCLDQEEQTAFEYAKQLVLGSLLQCCQKLSADNLIVEENTLDVELAVQCLRASTNPQTHHHALMLLSCLAALLPNQVVHCIMEIFTFMGSSVARLDDEYSVKIVTQVVESVVPVLVKTFSNENINIKNVIAEVLRVFVWALRDIPQHRRKPLFLQLLNTLEPERSLWIFLLLLFENYVLQGDPNKNEINMPFSLYLGLEMCLSMPSHTVLRSTLNILDYLNKLPTEKMVGEPSSPSKKFQVSKTSNDGLFSLETHTPKEIRHYVYTIVTFLNSLFADNLFVEQVTEATSKETVVIESVFKDALASLMTYIPVIARQYEKNQNRFWKVMVHQCYDILDKFVYLVSNEMLINVINKLLEHSTGSLRRKAMDLLNVRLQTHREQFTDVEKISLKDLLRPLLEIIKKAGIDKDQESEMLQQTALYSLKLLAKLLASEEISKFKEILVELCNVSKREECDGLILGSVLLSIAELVTYLKAHSISELPVFMPLMLKIFYKKSQADSADLGLISVATAFQRIVDVLPHFLSPYLDSLLFTVCAVSSYNLGNADLNKKLTVIRQKLANNVPHRVLIPNVTKCYDKLIEARKYDAIGPLLAILADSLADSSDILNLLPDLTQFFVSALELRSNCDDKESDVLMDDIGKVEGFCIEALVSLVLKLSESSFKPLYYKFFNWASEHTVRFITFYRLSNRLAESLKGLFVLFAGSFLRNAAELLDAVNLSKTKNHYYGNSEDGIKKSILLLENILKTLHSVFLFDSSDSSNFLNKDKFTVLLHPLIDQLENKLGGIEALVERTTLLVTPCIAQMALATEDTEWKTLNTEILAKCRNKTPQVRIGALETIVALATKLGENYVLLLPEAIGTLAELLEDEDERVETAMKNAVQRMEDVLGQPIREYFQ